MSMANNSRPKSFGSDRPVSGSKNLNFFKSMNGLRKQALPYLIIIFHSYAIELNCKLFFICVIYFINLLYLKMKKYVKKNVEF
jgi:hypothetical protein